MKKVRARATQSEARAVQIPLGIEITSVKIQFQKKVKH